ncbi:ubiquitin-conjugating enzyme E2 20 [Artemisia annua]|uniref:Ubiquitin-conjugating enzyme E2 20 n=1 Tax=Artemisia annua TaxID=35608 RepID=A0A2U1N835_ARTAN|nr:ubiquitin-conjugating enzyme E2 20 [Artemisia annua]
MRTVLSDITNLQATTTTAPRSIRVHKWLQMDLIEIMTSDDAGITAFPEEDNLFKWKGTISGSDGSVFNFSLLFPNNYPLNPPKVKFETCLIHPTMDVFGYICLDILADNWSLPVATYIFEVII